MNRSSYADLPERFFVLVNPTRVASPRLLEVNCKTIPQMRLANALCRFVELSSRVSGSLG